MTDDRHDPRDRSTDAGWISGPKAPEPELRDRPITGERYYSQEFSQRELERLWPRVWQVAGRVDQIPEAGDYVTYDVGRDSIIAVRGDDQRVRAFYNVCQHRGNRLVTAEVGSLAGGEFQRAYHGPALRHHGGVHLGVRRGRLPAGHAVREPQPGQIPRDTRVGSIWFNMDPTCDDLRTGRTRSPTTSTCTGCRI